jgi:hypothetical protein
MKPTSVLTAKKSRAREPHLCRSLKYLIDAYNGNPMWVLGMSIPFAAV